MSDESLPQGGLTPRKYSAICLALGMARGALHAAINGENNEEELKLILNITATANIAQALGYSESELAIIWNEHLSAQEINRIKGFG